jgi:hypothetical protein
MNQKSVLKKTTKLLFLLFCVLTRHSSAEDEVDLNEKAFLLRDGTVAEGKVMGIDQNIAILEIKRKLQYIPLYLFTPKARKYIIDIAPEKPLVTIEQSSTMEQELVPGPYEPEFMEISSFGEIIRAKEDADEKPVLIYVDPMETLLEGVQEKIEADPVFRNDMTWVSKKSFTRGSPDIFRTVSRQFNVQTPAFLILQKDKSNIGISNMETIQDLLDVIESYELKLEPEPELEPESEDATSETETEKIGE